MNNKKFNEEDKKKFVEFLNFIAKNAKFDGITVQNNIEFFKLLSHMQQVMLKKIDDNILEVIKVVEAKEEVSDSEKD